MSPWKSFEPKSGGNRGAAVPFISVRSYGLGFNKAFVEDAQLKKYRYVTVSVNPDTHELAVRPQSEKTKYALRLFPDGGPAEGKKVASGLMVETTTLIKEYEFLRDVSALGDPRAKRFEPLPEGDRWVIKVEPEPDLERVAPEPDEITPGVCGVYRCCRGNKIVKIGEGVVRDRFNHHRERFEFDRMEYSVIEDDSERKNWEKILLDEFRTDHGELPEQNLIRA